MTTGAPSSTILLRRATSADAARLAGLAEAAFVDTFAADNTPEDMAAYVAQAFGERVQRAELEDPAVTVFLAELAGELAGYAMVRERETPEVVAAEPALEIARLYAGSRWIGAGVGAALMARCLDEAAARGCRAVWLGVWERNARAIAFYRRWGFREVGAQPFLLGQDRQTDFIMTRHLGGAE